jgi:ATP-dependent exoDNAse (exonuclease V) beta subunit
MDFKSLIELESSFSDVFFIEKNHTYRFGKTPAKLSVSGLIKKYEKPFDSDKIAPFVAKRDGLSVEQVLNKWDFLKEYACHRGSEFHKFVENFLYRKQISIDNDAIKCFYESKKHLGYQNNIEDYYEEIKKLIKNFIEFYKWWKEDHILIKSEFVIGDRETGICGTIDNLSLNTKTNELVIFDYKTNKEIKKNNPRNETFISLLKHLENCEYVKYSLQLSLYSHILEKTTSFKIPTSYIVWVGGDEYEVLQCLNLKKESKIMLDNV